MKYLVSVVEAVTTWVEVDAKSPTKAMAQVESAIADGEVETLVCVERTFGPSEVLDALEVEE